MIHVSGTSRSLTAAGFDVVAWTALEVARNRQARATFDALPPSTGRSWQRMTEAPFRAAAKAALALMDSGSESPKETWLRLLAIRAGYPRPRTQIPVLSPDGRRWYYLDMGWEDLLLALEYDGDHHRTSRERFAYEIERAEDLQVLGWTVVKAAARHRTATVLQRFQRAWDACSH